MTQIILGSRALPETPWDSYSCGEVMLSVQVDMISGRRVIEQRGLAWQVSASYDYLDGDTKDYILSVLRSGAPFLATALPDNSTETVTAMFVTESLTPPTFLFDDNGAPRWHGLAFTIREEEPHG